MNFYFELSGDTVMEILNSSVYVNIFVSTSFFKAIIFGNVM